MKIFPTRHLNAELEYEYSSTCKQLKQETDITEILTSTWTNKKFRGTVTKQGFKLISSEIVQGAVCVFIGNFQGNSGTIEIRLHRAFQILFGVILTYPIIGFGLLLFRQGIAKSIQFIPVLLLGFLFIRYVFIGLTFKLISRTGLKKLTQTLNIQILKDKAQQNL